MPTPKALGRGISTMMQVILSYSFIAYKSFEIPHPADGNSGWHKKTKNFDSDP
jgi:hypothetical protein